MSKSKISFTRTSFFVKGVPKKVPKKVKGRRVSSSRKSKGIPVEGIPKKIHRIKGRKIKSSRRSKGILKRASRKKRKSKRRRRRKTHKK